MTENILHATSSVEMLKHWYNHRTSIIDQWFNNQFSEQIIQDWEIQISQSDPNTLKQSFIAPLLELLMQYMQTSDEKYLHVYLDERLRYAPHRRPLEERAEFFSLILEKDLKTLTDFLDDKDIIRQAKDILNYIHAPLLEVKKNRVSLVALGDCLMNEIRVFLPHLFQNENLQLDMRCIYFSAVMNKGLSIDEIEGFLKKNNVDLIAISFFSFEGIPPFKLLMKEVEQLSYREIFRRASELIYMAEDYLAQLRTITDATFLLHNVSGLPLSRYRKRIPLLNPLSTHKTVLLEYMNQELSKLSVGTDNCILLDEISVAEIHGYHNCGKEVTVKSVSRQAMFHTSIFGYYVSQAYQPVISKYTRYKKSKAICIDFDNTLWNGVMGDGEVEQYRYRQELLKTLKNQGIILIAVSKNSMENIRWNEMLLQQNDFALLKINWNLKVQSINEAADELNLGIDSFIFIDDNPVELELATRKTSCLICLDATQEQSWDDLLFLLDMPVTKDTKESGARTDMYQSQAKRNSIMKKELDYPEMMKSLGLKSNFREAAESDLERVVELLARTNQFNTTTIRYKKARLQEFRKSNNYHIFVSELEDKFGKLGIVCATIIEIIDAELVFDSFIMSCRAMGFSLENKMIRDIVNRFDQQTRYIGRYIPTDRNSPCSKLYESVGFTQMDENNWILSASDKHTLTRVTWIEDM